MHNIFNLTVIFFKRKISSLKSKKKDLDLFFFLFLLFQIKIFQHMANLSDFVKEHKTVVVVGGVVVGLAVVGTLIARCECWKGKCCSWFGKKCNKEKKKQENSEK